jgi:protein SCO1/2
MQTPSRIPWWLTALVVLILGGVVAVAELSWIKTAHKRVPRVLPVLATVPEFSLTSETGTTVTKQSLLGKIWVADFIFTRCAGPCPIMTENMRKLQIATRNLLGGGVQLISVTVDPEYDTSDVLSKYGAHIGSNPDRWSFLTGDPATVEKFITKGMLLGLSKDGKGVPIHSQKFVLVDREGYIRAYHDLEDPALQPEILTDIDALGREARTPKKKSP